MKKLRVKMCVVLFLFIATFTLFKSYSIKAESYSEVIKINTTTRSNIFISSIPSRTHEAGKKDSKQLKFEKYFKKNPIDAIEKKEFQGAVSTYEMVETEAYIADLWKSEITWAYDQLIKLSSGSQRKKFKEEKKAYINSAEDILGILLDEYEPMGGTIDRLNYASIVKEYYYDDAKKVYRKLFDYDATYKYYIESADSKK